MCFQEFHDCYPNDTDTDLFAYDGDGPIPRLTTHPQVFKVARFPIKMPKFAGVQKGEPIFMTIKMFFGMTEIKIEVHIRDRVFTFTSAFETLERGLGGVMNGMNNLDIHDKDLPAVQPRDSLFSSNSNLSSVNQTSPQPSLRNHDPYSYSSPASRYPRSFGGEDDGDSLYDSDSKHGKHGTARRLLGFKFGKRKDK